jgi:small GTP-binding protein
MENHIKVLLAGEPGVGKSTFVQHFLCGDSFESTITGPVTVAPDFKSIRHYLAAERAHVDIMFIDTPGQSRLNALLPMCLRMADVVFLVFSLTDRPSFESLQEHWPRHKEHLSRDNVIKVLIGNKADVLGQRQVSEDEAHHFAKTTLQAEHYYELSAKNGALALLHLPVEISLGEVLQQRRQQRQLPTVPLRTQKNPLLVLEPGKKQHQEQASKCCS